MHRLKGIVKGILCVMTKQSAFDVICAPLLSCDDLKSLSVPVSGNDVPIVIASVARLSAEPAAIMAYLSPIEQREKVGVQCRGCPAIRRTSSTDSEPVSAQDGEFVTAAIPRQRVSLLHVGVQVVANARVASGDIPADCKRSDVVPRLPDCRRTSCTNLCSVLNCGGWSRSLEQSTQIA